MVSFQITLSEYVHDGHQRFIAEFEDLRTSELGDGLFGVIQLFRGIT